jgi:hypothetical protein
MNKSALESFFMRRRQQIFDWSINHEIFARIFPHLFGKRDCGYPFVNDEQMNRKTEQLKVQTLLHVDAIEAQISKMPKRYGDSFRHIMHREIHERFLRYERATHDRISPTRYDWGMSPHNRKAHRIAYQLANQDLPYPAPRA